MSKSRNTKQKRDRPGNPNRSDDVRNRGARANVLIANSLSRGLEELAGLRDAMEEKELIMTGGDDLPPTIPEPPNNPPANPGGSGPNLPNCRPLETPYIDAPDTTVKVPSKKDILGFARMHFAVLGYSSQALSAAYAKTSLWMSRIGITDDKFTDDSVKTHLRQVWSVYYDRWSVNTWFERTKLAVYDWWCQHWRSVSLASTVALGFLVRVSSRKRPMVAALAAAPLMYWFWNMKKKNRVLQYPCPQLVDYCTGTNTAVGVPLANGARVSPRPVTNCRTMAFKVGFTINPGMVWIPRLCGHNELNALLYRQLLPSIGQPDIRKELWDLGRVELSRDLPPQQYDTTLSDAEIFEYFAAKYPLNRRSALRSAYLDINGTFRFPECDTKAFVKREWLVGKALNKRNPRLISGKTDDYLAETGPEYYLWMKHMCSKYWPDLETTLRQKFIYTGGMTGDQIGHIFNHFVQLNWHVVEGDYSRYDGHNEVEALEAEMDYYSTVLRPETVSALRRQLSTKGRTANGHTFSVPGKVASGVINTSFGNTIRGFMIVASWCALNDIKDFAVVQLGDDNLIFIKDLEGFKLPAFVEHCAAMGHKLEAVHRPDPDFAEYCSQRFWNIGSTYVLGPKPARVLAKTFITHDPTLIDSDMPEYCRQIAVGFKNYTWIPVLGRVIERWMEVAPTKSKRVDQFMRRNAAAQFHKIQLRETLEIDNASVYSQFVKIYGFDPLLLEEELNNIELRTGVAWWNELLDHMCEVDGVGTQSINYVEVVWRGLQHMVYDLKRSQLFA